MLSRPIVGCGAKKSIVSVEGRREAVTVRDQSMILTIIRGAPLGRSRWEND
jgi:hypothetical protein